MFKKLLLVVLTASLLLSGLAAAPANAATIKVTSAPAIAKVATVGTKLTASLAKFSAKATKVSWQWFYNGKAIAKANEKTYTVKATQKTGTIKVVETAMFGKTKKVLASNVIEIGVMWISGTASLAYTDANQTSVTISMPQILPKPKSIEYKWLRNNFDILGDGKAVRAIQIPDRGSVLAAKVDVIAPKGYMSKTLYTNEVSPTAVTRTYNTVWSDEFNGASGATVNTDVWVPENGDGRAYGNRGWGNNERQWYLFENATTDGEGALDILATRLGASSTRCYYGDCEWYSSKLVTKGKVGFLYGRLEARIKGAPGNGSWGAFWTLGADIDKVLWPWCGELDVIELIGREPQKVLGYSHGSISGGGGRGATVDVEYDWSQDYHTYAIDWLPDQIIWYVDGVKYGEVNKTDIDWVYDHENYLLLNLAMGGNLGGEIDPQLNSTTMKVDWVRFSTINGVGEVIHHK
jgi:beta-glucanase (GH16 family)